MTDGFISLRAVRKTYGPVLAVDGVDLDIPKGAFFSLLGPSGCGKTTLLTMLGGLDFPTSGSIHIDGSDVTGLPSYRRPTNMVFQSYAIFPHLSVAQNVGYGLTRSGLTRVDQNRQVDEMLELVHLEGYGTRRPDQLSGGQMQRVALARALVMRPKVLLLDEPLSALDKRLRQNMQIELRSLQREVGITFVFVTHDQEEALTLSDRIAVMARGRVLQCSDPIELYDRPNTREVAEFVGEMNFLQGTVAAAAPGTIRVSVADFGECEFSCGSSTFGRGDKVQVALRPENVTVSSDGPGASMRVVSRAYFGSHLHMVLAGEYANDAAGLFTASVPAWSARHLNSIEDGTVLKVSLVPESGVVLSD